MDFNLEFCGLIIFTQIKLIVVNYSYCIYHTWIKYKSFVLLAVYNYKHYELGIDT